MNIVLGSEFDPGAVALAEALPDAVLSGADDLSAPGWLHRVGAGAQFAVAGGRRVEESAIDAVVVRRPYVAPEELRRVRPEHRGYAAAEATAMLRSWLTAARYPVVNRPTAVCLGGPGWSRPRWHAEAARCGIPVTRTAGTRKVLVIGSETFGDAGKDPATSAAATALARHAGVDLLEVAFADRDDGPAFASADPWPTPSRPDALAALTALLAAGVRT